MEILFYLLLLIICEPIICILSIGIDHHCKRKNFKVKKTKLILLKSKFDSSKDISCVSYKFQIFNFVYILVYLSIAIIDVFIYANYILFSINFYSLIVFTGLSFIGLYVLAFIEYLKKE